MPEAPAWKFQPVLQDLALREPASVTLRGRVITGVGREVIENGHVTLEGGMITSVGEGGGVMGGGGAGAGGRAGSGGAAVVETGGTILAG